MIKRYVKVIFTFLIFCLSIFIFPKDIFAATISYTVTPEIPIHSAPCTGCEFFTTNLSINYQSGNILLSSQPDGTGVTLVDDAIEIQILRPNNTTSTLKISYQDGCAFLTPKQPKDITNYLLPGENKIRIKLYDECGHSVYSTGLYLVNLNAPDPIPSKTPIIIIPGIAASFNFGVLTDRGDTGWNWMITANSSWRQFINSLEKSSYQKDKDYFIAFYDWRKTNDWTDQDPGAALPAKKYLSEAIDKAKITNPGISKVNVVAHSMGGLVVRSYVESPNYRQDIDKAFLIGAPNAGSTFAYYTWEGAEVPSNWDPVSKAGLNMFIRLLSRNFNEEPYQMIHNHIKGIKDLLPVGYDYIFNSNIPLPWVNMQEINNFLKDTSQSQNTAHIFTNKNVQLINITGTGQNTWEKLLIENYVHPYFWKDGKPLGSFAIADGDNTVCKSSSILPGAEEYTITSNHADLPNKAASLIFNKLGINYTPSYLAGAPDEVLVAWVASPVSLEVINSQGNPVGESLIDPDNEMRWVFVENPENDYQINLVGTGSGPYHLGIDYYTDSQTNSYQTQGTAILNANLDYNLHINPENTNPLDLQPEDTIPPITQINLQGTLGINSWYQSDVNLSLLAEDNEGGTGLDRIEYSFDNLNWQKYLTPLVLDKEGIITIYYRSFDLVQNQEQTKQTEIKIDKTAPESNIFVDPDIDDLIVKGLDDNHTTVQRLDNTETNNENDAIYIITDESGHTLKIDVRERDKVEKDKFRIYSLQYDSQPVSILENNYFNIFFQDKKEKLNIKEQIFYLKDEIKIKIQYDVKKDQSVIIERENKEEKIKEVRDGLIILKLNTNHGQLEVKY